jgi:hypothetical protein
MEGASAPKTMWKFKDLDETERRKSPDRKSEAVAKEKKEKRDNFADRNITS